MRLSPRNEAQRLMLHLHNKLPLKIVAATLLLCAVLELLSSSSGPWFLVNFTDSVPLGVYRLAHPPEKLERGMYVALEPPPAAKVIAAGRPWFHSNRLFLKQVAAVRGDMVCNEEGKLTINGTDWGPIFTADKQGLPLPSLSGCRTLRETELFLLGPKSPWTFDSRYFGTIASSEVMYSASP